MDSRNQILYDIQVNNVNELDGIVTKARAIALEVGHGSEAISNFAKNLESVTRVAGGTFEALKRLATINAEGFQQQASIAQQVLRSLVSDAQRMSQQAIQSRLEAE